MEYVHKYDQYLLAFQSYSMTFKSLEVYSNHILFMAVYCAIRGQVVVSKKKLFDKVVRQKEKLLLSIKIFALQLLQGIKVVSRSCRS